MDPTYNSTSEGNGSALTEYDYLVTSTATASASSNISQSDANTLSQQLANQVAQSVATNDANIINQTLNIVNKEFIQPITSPDNIRIDQVVDSLNAFKKAFYNVDYLANLINTNLEAIISEGQYASVLQPIVELEYYNGTNDFSIHTIDLTNPANFTDYFDWEKYSFWSTLTYSEIVAYNFKNNLSFYNSLLLTQQTQSVQVLQELLTLYPNNSIYTYLSITNWDTGLQLLYTQYQKDVLNPSQWISIQSVIDLAPYLPNTDNLANFSKQYLTFVNAIANQIAYLNGTDFSVPAIWPYINPVYYSTSTCLQSSLYPQWTGSLISNCYIPGSDVDYPAIIQQEIVDLFGNYPPLVPGQIALLTYNLAGTYVVAFAQISTFIDPSNNTSSPAFKQLGININSYFTNNFKIINDTVINGSLTVTDYRGDPIIETDNVSQITSFHKKIGVNQNTYDVKGLVDINSLSFTYIQNILNQFTNPQLYSSDITIELNSTIVYDTSSVSIPINYQEDVFIFKCPIQNVIEPTNITFLYVPEKPNAFYTERFNSTSFLQIQTIVNEINKMIFENYWNVETQGYTFSFTELLNDTQNWYLCSLRGLIRTNPENPGEKEIYFIGGFLNVNSTVISDSYTEEFKSLTDQFSSCARLLNLSNLLVLNPQVSADLLQGNSIGSTNPNNPYFSDIINNSPYFRNRFGNPELYVFCDNFSTILQIQNQSQNNKKVNVLFNEFWPYFNTNDSTQLYYPNKNYNVYSTIATADTNFISSYGDRPVGSFIISYNFVSGVKISTVNIIDISGQVYMIGTGINLGDYISESIILKGDNTVTGNFSIVDSDTNNEVFAVNTSTKQNFSLYQFGIGTNNPTSKLTINSTGIGDIINSSNNLSLLTIVLCRNVQSLIDASSSSDFGNIIEKFPSFPVQPFSGPFLQTNDNYFYVIQIPTSLNGADATMIYNWYFPEWNGKVLSDITDPQYATQISNGIDTLNNVFQSDNVYNNLLCNYTFNWVFGTKQSIGLFFINNGILYLLNIGINVSTLKNDFNDNNIINLYNTINGYYYYLQDIYIRLNNVPPQNIPNFQQASDVRLHYLQQYPIQNLVHYTIPILFPFLPDDTVYGTLNDYIISQFDYVTLQDIPGTTVSYPNVTDPNLRTKYLSFLTNADPYKANLFYNLLQYYNYHIDYTGNHYGIINFEDNYTNFISCFWIQKYNINQENIGLSTCDVISVEFKINTILKPSVSLNGDLNINGNALFVSKNPFDQFMYIDSENNFIGVNAFETSNDYILGSIEDGNENSRAQQRQGVVFSTNQNLRFVPGGYINYPNVVCEDQDQYLDYLIPQLSTNSPLTVRKRNDGFTFQEMYTITQSYTTKVFPGYTTMNGLSTVENPQYTTYHYGPALSYEVKDSTGLTKILGRSFMGIDSIDPSYGFIKGGFGIQVLDQVPDPDFFSDWRNLLYLNNESQLSVNSLKLGGENVLSSDPSGNLSIQPQDASGNPSGNASINLLDINGTSNVLTVDTSGNLYFNGKKVLLGP